MMPRRKTDAEREAHLDAMRADLLRTGGKLMVGFCPAMDRPDLGLSCLRPMDDHTAAEAEACAGEG